MVCKAWNGAGLKYHALARIGSAAFFRWAQRPLVGIATRLGLATNCQPHPAVCCSPITSFAMEAQFREPRASFATFAAHVSANQKVKSSVVSVPNLLAVWNSEQLSFWHAASRIRFHNYCGTANSVRRREANVVLCDSEKDMSGAASTTLAVHR